jgi:hypothetical protein
MNYDYWDIGGIDPAARKVSLGRLATHIATDWVPSSPTSVATGLTALLDEVLESQPLTGTDCWLTRKSVVAFERQWRSVTSYMMGLAFCVETFLKMGYTWWAPVSFWKHNQAGDMPFLWWSPLFDALHCNIRQDTNNPSRLMPDFVLARRRRGGDFEIAFAEAKGCKQALQHWSDCPQKWRDQSHNAVFELQGVSVVPAQNIVVATRIQPNGIRLTTRKVQVRAWNNSDQATTIPTSAARELMLLHYAGVCMKLGMRNTAILLAHAPGRERQMRQVDQGSLRSSDNIGYSADMVGAERIQMPIRSKSVQAMVTSEGAVFGIGRKRLRIGFTPTAALMLDALAYYDDQKVEYLTEDLARDAERMAQSQDERVVYRADGIVATIEERGADDN